MEDAVHGLPEVPPASEFPPPHAASMAVRRPRAASVRRTDQANSQQHQSSSDGPEMPEGGAGSDESVRLAYRLLSPTAAGAWRWQKAGVEAEARPGEPGASKATCRYCGRVAKDLAASPPLPTVVIRGFTGVKEDALWASQRLTAGAGAGDGCQLCRRRTVCVFDNRGMGQSTVADGPYTLPTMADDVVELLDHLRWPRACVFGVSMGGMITQVLALRHPERLGRLVLGCTHSAGHYTQLPSADYGRALRAPPAAAVPMHGEGAAGMRDEEARRATEAAAEAYDRKMHAFNYTDAWVQRNARRVDAIFAWGRRATRSTEGTLAQYLAVREFVKGDAAAHDAALRRGVRSPVLVIHGDSDGIVPVGNGRRLLRALPPCLTSWYLVPGGGHAFWEMDDGASLAVVSRFLAGEAGGAPAARARL